MNLVYPVQVQTAIFVSFGSEETNVSELVLNLFVCSVFSLNSFISSLGISRPCEIIGVLRVSKYNLLFPLEIRVEKISSLGVSRPCEMYVLE